jgi:curli production assembly/transport component CsgE
MSIIRRYDPLFPDLMLRFWPVLAFAALAPQAHAQQTGAGQQSGAVVYEFQHLVVDETISRIGKEFYDGFYQRWESPQGAQPYTLRVEEQPSPGIGVRVRVLLWDQPIFEAFLQPRAELIEEQVGLAVRAATQSVQTTRRVIL